MKILLLSHGLFAQELLNSCRMIDPEIENVCALCLTEGGIESFSEKLNLYLKNLLIYNRVVDKSFIYGYI